MWWKKDDPSDKDAVRLVEALLGKAEDRPQNVIDLPQRLLRQKSKPTLRVVKDPEA